MKILLKGLVITVVILPLTGCGFFMFTSSSSVQALPDDVEQRYFALAKARPDDPDPWFRLGNWYVEQNQLEQAEHAYQQALQRGEHTSALHNLGLIRIRLGVKALQDAGQQLPADDPVHAETRRFLQTLLETAL